MLINHQRYGHSLGLDGYVVEFSVLEATIVNGDSFSCGLQRLVDQYSHTRFSYVSSHSQFQSSSHHQLHPHDGHGIATAVTIQLPHMSETGDGNAIHTFCTPAHIAIQSCAVNVGAA